MTYKASNWHNLFYVFLFALQHHHVDFVLVVCQLMSKPLVAV